MAERKPKSEQPQPKQPKQPKQVPEDAKPPVEQPKQVPEDAKPPVEQPITEIEVVEDPDDELDDELEEDLDSLDDAMFDPVQQFTQLLVTEAGVPIVDVLQGIQEALEKQNKILYKLATAVEAK